MCWREELTTEGHISLGVRVVCTGLNALRGQILLYVNYTSINLTLKISKQTSNEESHPKEEQGTDGLKQTPSAQDKRPPASIVVGDTH